ncbi:MAG: metal dependent phosphohydrolase [Ilumatobacteraceae bacterium]|nr:metal dependent phosphohydrolase [Ilumatobacteraceae bacterium]
MTVDTTNDTTRSDLDLATDDAALTASRRSARPNFDAIASDGTIDVLVAHGHAALAAGDLQVAERDLLDLLEIATVARRESEILRLRTAELERLIRAHTTELEEHQLETFERLAVMAEFRDTDTGEHTIRVGDLSAEIGLELGEDPAWCGQIRLAARLHDIGKVAVPDSILLKPGPLTPEEFEVMKTHTTIGAQILSGSSSPLIELGSVVALNHHERWDGTGYPNGRGGVDIPRCARIVTVADVFDALTSKRVYKHAWSHDDALAHVLAGRGTHFEPEIVDAFVRVIGRRRP